MMFSRRMKICVIAGAILGVLCIIGASVRSNSDASFLFALWYNRLLMGLVIGMAGKGLSRSKVITRGAFLGLIVSFAFYSSTGFQDVMSFLAGIVYGIIIESMAFKYGD